MPYVRRAHYDALLHAGAQLGNCAWNLSRRPSVTLSDSERESLREACQRWDTAGADASEAERQAWLRAASEERADGE